jgi:tetratricopeptide (TPR) repeat protein
MLLLAEASMAQVNTSAAVEDTALANQYFIKAEQFAEESDYDSSTFYFEKACVIYGSVAAQHNVVEIWLKHIQCYNGIGDNLWKKGEYNEALRVLQKAMELALNKLGRNHRHTAYCYNDVGVIYNKGDYDKALEYFNAALPSGRCAGQNHPPLPAAIITSRGLFQKAIMTKRSSITKNLRH